MNRINWELMRPQDIEIRPATTKGGKATLLLYQDSRNTMDALDRNFGEFGWKISYKDVAGQIYGCLSIKDPVTNEWISKEDTGEESNIAANKGLSSDILKRCAVRFGYGRELYTAPRINIDDDGYGCSGYKVSEISYNDDREIIHLVIVNRFGKETYRWDINNQVKPITQPAPLTQVKRQEEEPLELDIPTNSEALREFCKVTKTELNKENLVRFFKFYEPKANTWKGKFDIPLLWSKWQQPKTA